MRAVYFAHVTHLPRSSSLFRGILIGYSRMTEGTILIKRSNEKIKKRKERQAMQGVQRRLADLPAAVTFPFVVATILLLWEGLVRWQEYPAFILPSPLAVGSKLVTLAANGILWKHAQVTLLEIVLGLLLGVSVALLLGYLLGKSPLLDRLVSPYIVASQTVPVVAIAPLLMIWFGSGLLSKILITGIIVFFPTLVSTIVGIRGVDRDLHDMMRSLRASRSQLFFKLELPAALPVIFGGLKLSVILAVVGAVVGEFVGADVGLGFLINLGRGVLDTAMIFVAVFALVVIAQTLYALVAAMESHFLRWRR
jgi:NitT/TauT family transport system permease protein